MILREASHCPLYSLGSNQIFSNCFCIYELSFILFLFNAIMHINPFKEDSMFRVTPYDSALQMLEQEENRLRAEPSRSLPKVWGGNCPITCTGRQTLTRCPTSDNIQHIERFCPPPLNTF